MKVKHLPPSDHLAAYVERILVIESDQLIRPFSLPLFPNGSPTLLFKSVKATINNTTTANLILFGQTVLPEALTFEEEFTLIAYFFKPYSLFTIFKVTAQELTDKPIDLHLLSPRKTIELRERLLNATCIENMLTLLNGYVSTLIANAENSNKLIEYATTQIACKPSKEVLVSVQKELFITERTFQRMFEKNIGIAPGLYRRICQFNAAFQQLNNRNYTKLSDIAFRHGYADQSHYIRSFKEFTNLTPKDYLQFGS